MAINLYKHKEDAWLDASEMLEEGREDSGDTPHGERIIFLGLALRGVPGQDRVPAFSFRIYIPHADRKTEEGFLWTGPENVRFFTCARLMNRTEGEIAGIGPDYIVLGEFHRCGAEQGVCGL